MKVIFWGTRGSIPVSPDAQSMRTRVREILRRANGRNFPDDATLEAFINDELGFALSGSYGGSTSCVEIKTGAQQYTLFDMGSGLRKFGQSVISQHGVKQPQHYRFFLSHVHWDHIMGLPFFTPAYIPGNRIDIYGCHDTLEAAFQKQQSDPCFPVHWDQLSADIKIHQLSPGECTDMGDFEITPYLQAHHGDSFAYRLTCQGKTLVYSTDGEHKLEDPKKIGQYKAFINDADLVIFDAMYSLADTMTLKQDWGHSSNIVGLDLCRQAGVKHYCMFHHEPIHDDVALDQILNDTRRYCELTHEEGDIEISSAYDGLQITL